MTRRAGAGLSRRGGRRSGMGVRQTGRWGALSRGGEVECSAPVKAQAGRRLCLGNYNAFVGSGFRAPAGREGEHERGPQAHIQGFWPRRLASIEEVPAVKWREASRENSPGEARRVRGVVSGMEHP